jgi:hypothetical protein
MSSHYAAHFVAGSFLLLATTAHAQTTFQVGPRVGLNLTSSRFTGLYSPTPSAIRSGFEADLVGNLAVGHWALQPAVLFTQKGYTTHGSAITIDWPITYDEDMRYQYLTAPINVAYTQHQNGQGVQVFAGGMSACCSGVTIVKNIITLWVISQIAPREMKPIVEK